MSNNKIFKTLDEQIEILRSKGLTINDEYKAKEVLLRENYFFISGYRHLLMKKYKDSRFISGATFEELHSIFLFDRELRNIIFKHILVIENNIKSMISYQLSRKYGFKEKDYLNPNNFTQDKLREKQVYDVLNKMKRQIRVNGRQHSATMHYMDNYGYIPMWILVKVLSFGIISELFSILKTEDQQGIADYYKLDFTTLSIYLSLLANYRNLCAHEDMLYTYRTQRSIPNNIYHHKLNIPKIDEEYVYGKNDLFSLVLMFKFMLSKEDFKLLVYELGYEVDLLGNKLNSIEIGKVLDKIGFPTNWKDIVDL